MGARTQVVQAPALWGRWQKGKAGMTSPTARTLELLRRRGFTADVVERWLPHAGVRCDLFGFGDVLACHPRERVLLIVQATTAAHVAARLDKARDRPELGAWLQAGGAFQVWGWAKQGDRWRVKVVAVQAEDLAGVVVQALPKRRRTRHRQQELFDALDGGASGP
jgi:hypothetical protein